MVPGEGTLIDDFFQLLSSGASTDSFGITTSQIPWCRGSRKLSSFDGILSLHYSFHVNDIPTGHICIIPETLKAGFQAENE
jgi:hypothetical protein